MTNTALLLLENGQEYYGKAIGRRDHISCGELVFNTGMTGYQEILTDPSYAGQIVTLTYPEIGNYGTNISDNQSRAVFAAGLVIRNLSPVTSSWRAESDLDSYMSQAGISGIYDIDTRDITLQIRREGALRSLLYTGDISLLTAEMRDSLMERLLAHPSMAGQNLMPLVTTPQIYRLSAIGDSRGRIAVIDLGLKRNMLDIMTGLGYDLTVYPSNTPLAQIVDDAPDGVFLSNGPGDPAACTVEIDLIRGLLDLRIPLFGVCLGHQLLSSAIGATTYKLKFGHRGSNHPVLDIQSGKVLITSQNHGFAVDADSVSSDIARVTHISLNDRTVEGIELIHQPAFSVQFHPEACPGPTDAEYLFARFVQMMETA